MKKQCRRDEFKEVEKCHSRVNVTFNWITDLQIQWMFGPQRTFIVVQSLTRIWPFVTPWIVAHHNSLSFTISQSLLKHMSIESVMLSHPLSPPSPFAFNLSHHQGLFQWIGSLHQVPKYWSFSISPSSEYSGLIAFRIDWFDLLAVHGTLQEFSPKPQFKASVLWRSAFFIVQLSHP